MTKTTPKTPKGATDDARRLRKRARELAAKNMHAGGSLDDACRAAAELFGGGLLSKDHLARHVRWTLERPGR